MNHCHWSSQTFFRSTNTKTYWYVENILKNSIGSTVCDWLTASQVKLRQPTHWFSRQDKFAYQYEQIQPNLDSPEPKESDGHTVEWRPKLDLKENVGFGQAEKQGWGRKIGLWGSQLLRGWWIHHSRGQSARVKVYAFNELCTVKIKAEETT